GAPTASADCRCHSRSPSRSPSVYSGPRSFGCRDVRHADSTYSFLLPPLRLDYLVLAEAPAGNSEWPCDLANRFSNFSANARCRPSGRLAWTGRAWFLTGGHVGEPSRISFSSRRRTTKFDRGHPRLHKDDWHHALAPLRHPSALSPKRRVSTDINPISR